MGEFTTLLPFVAAPFIIMLLFALLLPPVGATLHMRSEILVGLALVPLSGGVITLWTVVGISPASTVVLLCATFGTLFGILTVVLRPACNAPLRQTRLAALFVAGTVLTPLLMSFSARTHAHLGYLLRGEMLALGRTQLLTVLVLWGVALVAGTVVRAALFAYCIDEEYFRLRCRYGGWFATTFRMAATLIIATAVFFMGPVLTLALLIFPPLFTCGGKGSIRWFFVAGVLVAITGSSAGFAAALATDTAPAFLAAAGIALAGGAYAFLVRWLPPTR